MTLATVFIVSEDTAICDSITELVASAGLRAESFSSLDQYQAQISSDRKGCMLLDMQIHEFSEPTAAARFSAICALRPVLLLVDRGDVPIAVRAIKYGALNVLEKPCGKVALISSIECALALSQHVPARD
jgi:FixJ family two-component response regulator